MWSEKDRGFLVDFRFVVVIDSKLREQDLLLVTGRRPLCRCPGGSRFSITDDQ